MGTVDKKMPLFKKEALGDKLLILLVPRVGFEPTREGTPEGF